MSTNLSANLLVLSTFATAMNLSSTEGESYVPSVIVEAPKGQDFLDWDELALSIPEKRDYSDLLALKDFGERLIKGAEEMDPEISRIMNENFWDLI